MGAVVFFSVTLTESVFLSVLRERRMQVMKSSSMYMMSNEAADEQALGQLLKLLQL